MKVGRVTEAVNCRGSLGNDNDDGNTFIARTPNSLPRGRLG